MVEPSGHCPYLGLKQNQAIRFASPTPEHRCYATGQALEIPTIQPDYQASYCLSSGHIRCPLYTGLGLPSMPEPVGPARIALAGAPGGLRGWFGGLPLRDRAIYVGILTLLAVILAVYTVAGMNLLRSNGIFGGDPSLPALGESATAAPTPSVAPTSALAASPTHTAPPAPSATPNPPSATLSPPPPSATPAPVFIPPTITFTPSVLDTVTPELPTEEPPTEEPPTEEPPTAEPPTAEPPTTTAEPPTATAEPPTVGPTPDISRTSEPQPPPTPQASVQNQLLTLYFTDATDTLFVSVARLSRVVDQQVARAAIEGLIAGPNRPSLKPLLPPATKLLGARRAGGTLVANFDRRPAWPGDERGLYAIAYSLTELPGVSAVQIQVNGANIGVGGTSGPIPRRAINPDNPRGLDDRFDSGTRFLALYFLSSADDWVRVTRLVDRTNDVARATLTELLAGPGSYGDRLYSPIPAGTALSGAGLRADGDLLVVDLSAPFRDAYNRQAAVDALVYAITELRDSAGARRFGRLEILVEGRKLSDYWGRNFDRQFTRRPLNPE
jgi:spore germination protein GerM